MSVRALVPPGYVDALCLVCRPAGGLAVTLPEGTLTCPNGTHDVEPLSLPHVPMDEHTRAELARLDREEGGAELAPVRAVPIRPKAVAAENVVQSISLPTIRESSTWIKATDGLLNALEREEAEAMSALEVAKERARAARRAANAMRQVRGLVTSSAAESASAWTTPKPVTTDSGKPWAKEHGRCIVCGTTKRAHAVQGRCTACHAYFKAKGVERPRDLDRASS